MKRCAICGGAVRGTFWTCTKCKTAFALPDDYANWPAWAKALVNSEQAERRYEQRWAEHRPQVDALRTRPDGADGLPDTPYDDDEANGLYRRANGITRPGKH